MRLNGRVGQVIGPFTQNIDLLADDQAIGQFTPETTRPIIFKLGVQAKPGTLMEINGHEIKVGKTGIYQLDQVVNVTSFKFKSSTDSDTIVDFCY